MGFKIKKMVDKEYLKFLEFLNDFFDMESRKWNDLKSLKFDEFLDLILFYEDFLIKLDGMYPKSRKNSELNKHKLKGDKYTFKRGEYTFKCSDYKFHHYLFAFHYILEDRLDFFKNLKIAIESWNQKKFNSALKHYKIIYNSFLEIKEKLSEIEGTARSWYRKEKYTSIDYGSLPIRSPIRTRTKRNFARGFSDQDIKNRKFKKVINIVKSRLEDLNQFFQYKKIIKLFSDSYKTKSYNLAFDKYIKAEYHKNKIMPSNLEFFGVSEKEKDFKLNFTVVVLNLTNKIKKAVLDLGTKFTKLEIKEIKEKCNVESTDLIVDVIKKMIKDKMIYAEYFSSSSAIAFDQRTNIEEIDNLLKKYEQWEKEEKEKYL